MSDAFPMARRPRQRSAMSLIEVLLGLSIAVALFTSLAFALQSAIKSEQVNREYARSIQTARTMLYNLTYLIRNSHAVDLEDASGSAGQTISGKNIRVQERSDSVPTAFRWDGSKGQLMRDKNANEPPGQNRGKVAGDLKDVTFKVLLAQHPKIPLTIITQKVTISVVVGNGPNQVTLSASASPRSAVKVY